MIYATIGFPFPARAPADSTADMKTAVSPPRTWLLSGIPRSGTSLCCRLAGELPDWVALAEPLRLDHGEGVDGLDPRADCTRIEALVGRIRDRIRAERRVPSKQYEGRLDDNRVVSGYTDAGLRRLRAEWGEIVIDKSLSSRFGLLIKHNSAFAALLHWLAPSFPCVALVRNPLAVLASWQTVHFPIQQGRIPGGELFDHALRRTLEQEPDPLRRQIVVLNWFFARYRAHLPPEHVIRYEDLVGSGGMALFRLLGHAGAEPVTLKSRNGSALYGKVMAGTLLEALLESGGSWTHFYSPEDCERTAEKIREN